MAKRQAIQITGEMLETYHQLTKQKKEIDRKLNELKLQFHDFFDETFGMQQKGELKIAGWSVQRQIRRSEGFTEEAVHRLEKLQLEELIETVKKPNPIKIASAIELGLLKNEDIEDCRTVSFSPAITVREH